MTNEEIFTIAKDVECELDGVDRAGNLIRLRFNKTQYVPIKVNGNKQVLRDRVSQGMRLIRMKQANG